MEGGRLLEGDLQAPDHGARILQRLLEFALFLVRRLRRARPCPNASLSSERKIRETRRRAGTWLTEYLSGILRLRLAMAGASSVMLARPGLRAPALSRSA